MTLDYSRQKAFEKVLRPPCVELSQVALHFRSKTVGARKVLDALQTVHKVLRDLGQADALDEKLANYAFFPLQHIFNEAKQISSACLELAVRCLQILVSRGWRAKLDAATGKQLIILLSLLAGGIPGGSNAGTVSEELAIASLECMSEIFYSLRQRTQGKSIFDENETQTLVDQSVYMLLEKVTDDASPDVQLAASNTLRALHDQLSNRALLASLFPRTVSALTKALRASTKARRTYKVLVANIRLLSKVIEALLNDREIVATSQTTEGKTSQVKGKPKAAESTILDTSWLKATSSQVKLALTHVVHLKHHDRLEVREALAGLCEVIIDTCFKSLSEAIPLMIETLVVLAYAPDNGSRSQAFLTLSHLISSDPVLSEVLESKLHSWTSSLPRVMQGNDDIPKQRILRQISTTVEILSRQDPTLTFLDNFLASSLCDSLAMALPMPNATAGRVFESRSMDMMLTDGTPKKSFDQVIYEEKSQQGSLAEVETLILNISRSEASNSFTNALINTLSHSEGNSRLAALWLSLRVLSQPSGSFLEFSDFINVSPSSITHPYLVDELYNINLPAIIDSSSTADWRITALSLEGLVLQAQQLGQSFRPELIQVLYPMLSFLGSSQELLREHAITALNLLSVACEYEDVSSMLVENVDYLINAVSLELTSSDISPQAAQVLLMMVRLCGAKVIPYLDDMIESIFLILDQYHGYPRLVEMLFEVLSVIIDEGAKQPRLAIKDGKEVPKHRKPEPKMSAIDDIIRDLRRRGELRTRANTDISPLEVEDIDSHPKRPWTARLDGPPSSQRTATKSVSDLSSSPSSEQSSQPEPEPDTDNDKPAPLSKPHNLFLSIANATPPHLSSPSPRVRLTILHLLTRIAPLLSVDENSFLPAVNAIWPSLVARLIPSANTSEQTTNAQSLVLSKQHSSMEVDDQEPVYTSVAAAEAITALCRGAGDFMTTRIEALFPELQRMFIRFFSAVYSTIERQDSRRQDAVLAKRVTPMELQSADSVLRGNDVVVLKALVELLCTALEHVRLDEDVGDGMVKLLVRGVLKKKIGEKVGVDVAEVKRVCGRWNEDWVWLLQQEEIL